jgi:hypothetical protein
MLSEGLVGDLVDTLRSSDRRMVGRTKHLRDDREEEAVLEVRNDILNKVYIVIDQVNTCTFRSNF